VDLRFGHEPNSRCRLGPAPPFPAFKHDLLIPKGCHDQASGHEVYMLGNAQLGLMGPIFAAGERGDADGVVDGLFGQEGEAEIGPVQFVRLAQQRVVRLARRVVLRACKTRQAESHHLDGSGNNISLRSGPDLVSLDLNTRNPVTTYASSRWLYSRSSAIFSSSEKG
jgi:hypothetical protein